MDPRTAPQGLDFSSANARLSVPMRSRKALDPTCRRQALHPARCRLVMDLRVPLPTSRGSPQQSPPRSLMAPPSGNRFDITTRCCEDAALPKIVLLDTILFPATADTLHPQRITAPAPPLLATRCSSKCTRGENQK